VDRFIGIFQRLCMLFESSYVSELDFLGFVDDSIILEPKAISALFSHVEFNMFE
jgi:hypothetical protein